MRSVPDASFVMAGVDSSERDADALAMLRDPLREWWAPPVLTQELHHALLKLERRGRLAPARTDTALQLFAALDIRVIDDPAWPRQAFDLARQLNCGYFDAIYLVAALAIDAEFWTLDARLIRTVGSGLGGRVKTLA